MKRLLTTLLLLAVFTATADEQSITLKRDFGTLYGTLLTPEKGAETVALIIAGSGPTDRNGNAPQGLSTNCYLYLAQALEKAGIASLRYDKRAIAASSCDDPSEIAKLTLDHYIGDAVALVDYLSSQGFRKVVIIGHSEGALIALCAAQQTQSATAVVSVAGPGYPLDQILQQQLAAQLIPANIDLIMEANGMIAQLKRGEKAETANCHPGLRPLFNDAVQPFLISMFRYDPREQIAKLSIPVLIVNGDNDLQIPVANADELAKAQPKAKKIILAGMTHTLKKSDKRTLPEQAMTVYADSTLPLDTDFAEAVTGFINDL